MRGDGVGVDPPPALIPQSPSGPVVPTGGSLKQSHPFRKSWAAPKLKPPELYALMKYSLYHRVRIVETRGYWARGPVGDPIPHSDLVRG